MKDKMRESQIDSGDRHVTAKTWSALLSEGCDFDSWGQPVEAVGVYSKLKRSVDDCVAGEMCHGSELTWSIDERQERILSKISLCLHLRSQALRQSEPLASEDALETITLEDMRCLIPWISHVLEEDDEASHYYKSVHNFPVELSTYQQQQQILLAKTKAFSGDESYSSPARSGASVDNGIEDVARGRIGSLLPIPVMEKGKTYISLKIEKIGLKDAADFMDPYMTISVKNMSGSDITMPQSTPIATRKDSDFVYFDKISVHLQKPMEYLPVGFAIFIEFKHYKPAKKKTSLKCFCFLEKDELVDGASLVLELYKKPLDVKRKKLKLLTSKEQYLHLETLLRVD